MDQVTQFLTSASGLWWPLLIFVIFCSLFTPISQILSAFSQQISSGARIKYGDLEFHGVNVVDSSEAELVGNQVSKHPASDAWFDTRSDIYRANKNFFIIHKIRNSIGPGTRNAAGRRFDIELSLRSHKGRGDLGSIQYVEYYFGDHFGPGQHGSIFKVEGFTGGFAVITSAYGEFLCLAKITFRDGSISTLQRYIDFAMAPALPKIVPKNGAMEWAM